MNRIDRLAAILIHLQSKSIVTADEIADRFEISKRTVYRDIRALEEAGVPIGAEAGKGYFITEGYHLPPVRFSREEASALLIAHKLIDKLGDRSVQNQYESAMFKIKSVLQLRDKEFLETVNNQVQIYYSNKNEDGQADKIVTTILHSLSEHRMIKIDYHSYSKDETTNDRLIEPIGVCYYGGNWHLIGYCLLRDDYRDFRADRIKKIELTNRHFEIKKRPTLDEYFQQLAQAEDLFPVILRFNKGLVNQIDQAKYYYGFISQTELDDAVEMKFLVNSYDYIARWILTHIDQVEIIEPLRLQETVKSMIKKLEKKYQ